MITMPQHFLCFTFVLCSFTLQANDRTKLHLSGPVKSVVIYEFEAKGKIDSPVKGKQIAITEKDYNYSSFNDAGMITEQRAQLNDSVILGKRILKYRNDSIESEHIYNGTALAEKISYERDKNQRLVAVKHSNEKGPVKSFRYNFNESNNSLTWQELNSKDTLNKYVATPQNIYFFNDKGMPVSVDHYTYSNPTTMIKATRSAWNYDTEGRLTGYTDYFKNNGVKLDKKWFYSEGMHADSLIETENLYSGVLKKKTVSRFDDNGNLTGKTEFVQETNTTDNWSYKYEFDEKGNWTKRISILNSKPINIAERKIEYYIPVPKG